MSRQRKRKLIQLYKEKLNGKFRLTGKYINLLRVKDSFIWVKFKENWMWYVQQWILSVTLLL